MCVYFIEGCLPLWKVAKFKSLHYVIEGCLPLCQGRYIEKGLWYDVTTDSIGFFLVAGKVNLSSFPVSLAVRVLSVLYMWLYFVKVTSWLL